MTRDEIMTLGLEEIETRAAQIAEETAEADMETLETLNAELDAIEERKKAIAIETEEKRKAAEAVAAGAGEIIEKREEIKPMENKEIRNTPEYIEAFAKYVKTGKDLECRKLLTTEASGTVPIPEFVDDAIQTAWENDEIFSRVSKTFVPGNDKVAFEWETSGAAVHMEGADANAQETLKLGVVELNCQYIKKWLSVSDKTLAMGPRDLLTYLYDEFEYQIIKKIADLIVAGIFDAVTVSDAANVGVPQVEGPVTPANILAAIGMLSSNARDRVFIASGATITAVRQAALSASYAYDPFFGLTVIQCDALTEGAVVGDLAGVRVNLPEGGEVKFLFDELSLAEEDLVKVVGKLLVGYGVVRPGMFANITGQE